jgi:hypothetical protein
MATDLTKLSSWQLSLKQDQNVHFKTQSSPFLWSRINKLGHNWWLEWTSSSSCNGSAILASSIKIMRNDGSMSHGGDLTAKWIDRRSSLWSKARSQANKRLNQSTVNAPNHDEHCSYSDKKVQGRDMGKDEEVDALHERLFDGCGV